MQTLVVYGAGELGGRVAALWRAAGGAVLAASRTTTRHRELQRLGIETVLGSPLERVGPDDVLLLSLPGTHAQAAAVDGLRALRTAALPARVVLISSTGFHSGTGGTVNEASAAGGGARPQAIAGCEAVFTEVAGSRGVVLRCGGLYRPGRGPLESLRRRARVDAASGVVRLPGSAGRALALVHYDDAAAAARAALLHPSPAPVYLCVTPPCPTRGEYYVAACAALGLGAPEFDFDTARGVDSADEVAAELATGNESGPARELTPGPAPEESGPVVYDVAQLRRDLLPRAAHPDWRAATRA